MGGDDVAWGQGDAGWVVECGLFGKRAIPNSYRSHRFLHSGE